MQNPVRKFDKEKFKKAVLRHLQTTYATTINSATQRSWYLAMVKALTEMTTLNLIETEEQVTHANVRRINYFSLEFLIGRLTGNNLISLDIFDDVKEVMHGFGCELSDLLEVEHEPALGNGGLGRLAACYMDSLAAHEYPAIGYGLHYQYGLFRQEIIQGHQQEVPNNWLGIEGYPWEVIRPEHSQEVGFYGYVEVYTKNNGQLRRRWHPSLLIDGVAWDLPIVGYKNNTVYPLRLWEARSEKPFNLSRFDQGDYVGAQFSRIESGNITKVLYPNDNHEAGKTLRLMQQYFQCACSIADMLQNHSQAGRSIHDFAQYETIQLNDTHPTVAIPELMRVLIDSYELEWDEAWEICQKTFAYTNHTLLPEALEKWSAGLIEKLLPRHLEIIYEINRRFMNEVEAHWPGDVEKKRRMSIFEDQGQRMVRMANLCVITSYAVNGVAKIHSELVKRDLFPEFNELYPNKLMNVTNGVTPRRWLKSCNQSLSALIDEKIGDAWPGDLYQLAKLKEFADDTDFQQDFMAVKKANKKRLADWIKERLGVALNTEAIFDVQIKRLHEYKRQHLNLLHILSLYYRLLNDPSFDMYPRVFIFAAKAAPGYTLAKDIIYAINMIGKTINNDVRIKDKIKVIFMPNYSVSLAELIIPAADVSEQISTAGKEASGTGNMKLAMNGALTIGTMDGANVEIREEVGDENIFIFGLLEHQVAAFYAQGYDPRVYYEKNPLLKSVLDWLETDDFTPGQPGALSSIRNNLLFGGDHFLVLADFSAYREAQKKVEQKYLNPTQWARSSIINTASMGKFSSDRSIEDYATKIWHLQPVKR